jgi:sorting nexin-1/2
MNSFDDLENPFEDPFAKSLGRSSSPDPWASFTAPSQLLSADSYDRAQPEVVTPSATESESAQQQQQDNGPEQELQAVSAFVADPLDSAAFTAEDEPLGHESPRSPRKPGFRESVVTSFDEIATIRPTVPEDLEPSRPAYGPEPSPPLSPALFNQHHAERIASGSSAVSFGPSTSTSSATQSDRERIVVSPLEQSPSLDRPFASLALGGESIPSWQGPQSAWQDDTSVKPSASFSSKAEDDDDDDDQPIGTRLTAGEGSTSSVSSPFLLLLRLVDERVRHNLHLGFQPLALCFKFRSMIHKRSGIQFEGTRCTPFTLEYVQYLFENKHLCDAGLSA